MVDESKNGSEFADVESRPSGGSAGGRSLWRMGLAELMGLQIVLGAVGGTMFAVVDIQRNASTILPRDAIVAVVFSAVPAIGVMVYWGLMLAAASRLVRWSRPRKACFTLSCAAMVVGLAAAIIVVGTEQYRDVKGLLLLLFPTALVVAVVCVFTLRMAWLAERGRALSAALLLWAGLLWGLCGVLALRDWFDSTIVGIVWVAGTSIGCLWALRRVRSVPRRVAAGASVCLVLTAGVSLRFGDFGSSTSLVPARQADPRPNVVLIVLDTTRRDYLGCYGHSGGLSPEFDRIAAEGVVYEQAISTAPWTVPSHASMFTGLHPVTHGCSYQHRLWLDDDFETLAETLNTTGYQTVALSSNVYLEPCNMLQGFDHKVHLIGPYDRLSLHGLARAAGVPARWADKGSAEACDELSEWLTTSFAPERPLFLFVNLLEPHQPYLPPWADRAAAFDNLSASVSATRLAMNFDPSLAHARRDQDPEVQAAIRALYSAAVSYQDRRLGELLGVLGKAIDLDNTLLIVTADHGENLGENGRWEHLFAINDTLIHVPLVIRYPRLFPAGTRVSGLCQLIDLFPTVCEVAGVAHPVLPGLSLLPDRNPLHGAAFAEIWPFYPIAGALDVALGFQTGSAHLRKHLRTLRTLEHKYIFSSDGDHELYDIVNDPFETTNLRAAEPEIAERLDRQLREWWGAQPAYVRREATVPEVVPEKALDQLRSLGYVR